MKRLEWIMKQLEWYKKYFPNFLDKANDILENESEYYGILNIEGITLLIGVAIQSNSIWCSIWRSINNKNVIDRSFSMVFADFIAMFPEVKEIEFFDKWPYPYNNMPDFENFYLDENDFE